MKLVKEHINEKFEQDSDPIHDMGIGKNAVAEITHAGDGSCSYVTVGDKTIAINYPKNVSDKDYEKEHDKFWKKIFKTAWNMGAGKIYDPDSDDHPFKITADDLSESLNEKFEQDSDPIHDMGIGLPALEQIWKAWYKKIGKTSTYDTYKEYFQEKYPYKGHYHEKHIDSVAMFIYLFLENLVENKIYPINKAFRKTFKDCHYRPVIDREEYKKIIIEFINKNLNINLNIDDFLNESVDINLEEKRCKQLLSHIIPVSVHSNSYYNIRNFLLTVINNPKTTATIINPNIMRIKVDTNHNDIFSKDLKYVLTKYSPGINRVHNLKSNVIEIIFDQSIYESLNEKFVEDSDPIQDMGIGLRHKIETWIENINKVSDDRHQMGIRKYRINNDGSITIFGNVSIPDNYGNLPEFINFKYVSGDFIISTCNLTTLRGCPKKVKGTFSCSNNLLKSLEFAPKYVSRNFECFKNVTEFTKKDVLDVCVVKGDIIEDEVF